MPKCRGKTRKGKKCPNKVKKGELYCCRTHARMVDGEWGGTVAVRCKAWAVSTEQRCRNKSYYDNGLCKTHKKFKNVLLAKDVENGKTKANGASPETKRVMRTWELEKEGLSLTVRVDLMDLVKLPLGNSKRPWKGELRDYFKTEEWRDTRRRLMALHGGVCGFCGGEAITAHHPGQSAYTKLGIEGLGHLTPICDNCNHLEYLCRQVGGVESAILILIAAMEWRKDDEEDPKQTNWGAIFYDVEQDGTNADVA